MKFEAPKPYRCEICGKGQAPWRLWNEWCGFAVEEHVACEPCALILAAANELTHLR